MVISNGFMYIAFLMFLSGSLLALKKYAKWRVFTVIPPIIWCYLLNMIFCTIGLYDSPEVERIQMGFRRNLLYAMLFVMLLRCDLRKFRKLGSRIVAVFVMGSITIMAGFLIGYPIFKPYLGPDTWGAVAALYASWVGGSGNMAAMLTVLPANGSTYGKIVTVDSVCYSLWLAFVLYGTRFTQRWNQAARANTFYLQRVAYDAAQTVARERRKSGAADLTFMVGASLLVSAGAQAISVPLSIALKWLGLDMFDAATTSMLLVTILGLACAMTRLGKSPAIDGLSTLYLYAVISLLASSASFTDFLDAPIWVVYGFFVLVIHAALMFALSTLFQWDLCSRFHGVRRQYRRDRQCFRGGYRLRAVLCRHWGAHGGHGGCHRKLCRPAVCGGAANLVIRSVRYTRNPVLANAFVPGPLFYKEVTMRWIIQALGGSGEHGRNCYALTIPSGTYLFDCGVKRTVSGHQVGVYPVLPPELVPTIRAVFLSHAHQDHCAAPPLLYHLGYRGPVYASPETLEAVPEFLQKWRTYVLSHGGSLPYTVKEERALQFMALRPGRQDVEGLDLTCGRSGHMLGSLWFHITEGDQAFLYTGDTVWNPFLLARDPAPVANVAIVDCAYAGRSFSQEAQNRELLLAVRSVLQRGGKALFPLPAKGRAADVWTLLEKQFPQVPLYVDAGIAAYRDNLFRHTQWLKEEVRAGKGKDSHIVRRDAERLAVCQNKGPALILTQDGMLTAPEGLFYYKQLKRDERNAVFFTGKLSKGSEGDRLMEREPDREAPVLRRQILIKVHLDEADCLAYCRSCHVRHAVLFHAEQQRNRAVLDCLRSQGIDARLLAAGETWIFDEK
jgi:uncharacterized membrane protein/Cft2 family RNA processing exonuclease